VSGVIELKVLENHGKPLMGVRIKKFRGSSFDEEIRPYRITDRGIVVYWRETLF
jgi:KaiC/GvpD/RAD55 family RecA-like ATPase